MLPAPDDENSESGGSLPLASSASLLGAVGTVVTTLRPAGKARFGDELIDVVGEGSFVDVGRRVQVIEIDGVHVIVKAI